MCRGLQVATLIPFTPVSLGYASVPFLPFFPFILAVQGQRVVAIFGAPLTDGRTGDNYFTEAQTYAAPAGCKSLIGKRLQMAGRTKTSLVGRGVDPLSTRNEACVGVEDRLCSRKRKPDARGASAAGLTEERPAGWARSLDLRA